MRAAILLAFIGGYFVGALAQEAREATRFERRALRSRCTSVPLSSRIPDGSVCDV